jgi:hypothetical protein
MDLTAERLPLECEHKQDAAEVNKLQLSMHNGNHKLQRIKHNGGHTLLSVASKSTTVPPSHGPNW